MTRFSRVVYEIENLSSGFLSTSSLTSVVLPAPDGAAITKRLALFDILNLFAHLLDQHLEFYSGLGGLGVCRFRSQRVGLPVQFLREEVETSADRFAADNHVANLADVTLQAIEFFIDIELIRDKRQLGLETNWSACL